MPSPDSKALMDLFREKCRAEGMIFTPEECFNYMYELPDRYEQMSLFDKTGSK